MLGLSKYSSAAYMYTAVSTQRPAFSLCASFKLHLCRNFCTILVCPCLNVIWLITDFVVSHKSWSGNSLLQIIDLNQIWGFHFDIEEFLCCSWSENLTYSHSFKHEKKELECFYNLHRHSCPGWKRHWAFLSHPPSLRLKDVDAANVKGVKRSFTFLCPVGGG